MHHLTSLLSPRAMRRSVALWLFGIFTTLLLVGLWGRSVTGDQATLEESTRAVLESEVVNRRMTDWLADAVDQMASIGPVASSEIVKSVMASPEVDVAIEAMVDATVDAALAPPDQASSVDLAPVADNLWPAVERAVAQNGLPLDSETAQSVLGDFVLSSRDLGFVSSALADTRSLLTKVVLIGLAGVLASGGYLVWIAEDRLAQLRSLSWKVALSSFTFALMLRLGVWAADPAGGRSPIAAGGSVVLRSNGHVPVSLAVAFASLAGATSLIVVRRRRRPQFGDDRTDEQPVLTGVR